MSLRLAEVLGALASATDLAAGVPMGTSVRTCLVATRLGELLGQRGDALSTTYYVALLRHLGCTAFSHEAAHLGAGDDHDVLRTFEGTDPRDTIGVATRSLDLRRDASFGARALAIGRVLSAPSAGRELAAAHCDQASSLSADLGLGDEVARALSQIYERYSGGGSPRGLTGDGIAVSARLLHAAQSLEIGARRGGFVSALEGLSKASGRTVDPEIVRVVLRKPEPLASVLALESTWDAYLDAEPFPRARVSDLDTIAVAFARYADLKSPWFLGHSEGVARLVRRATEASGDGELEGRVAYRAALLHDIGIVGVPNGIWEKRGPLDAAESEQCKMHAFLSARILAKVPGLSAEARVVGLHHERCDGSGYPSGLVPPAAERLARRLAAADAYRAMLEERPHRAALGPAAAEKELRGCASRGELCPRAVADVLAAAGHTQAKSEPPSHGLTAREVEVLVKLARGLTNKEVSAALRIAPRTVQHHVENIYAKIGVSTRAAAALFAVRNELVVPTLEA